MISLKISRAFDVQQYQFPRTVNIMCRCVPVRSRVPAQVESVVPEVQLFPEISVPFIIHIKIKSVPIFTGRVFCVRGSPKIAQLRCLPSSARKCFIASRKAEVHGDRQTEQASYLWPVVSCVGAYHTQRFISSFY